MSAEDATLRERLVTVRTEVWLLTGMLPKVDCHVTALRKGAAAAINQTFEGPLVSVRLRVQRANRLAHLFRDGLETFLPGHVFVLVAVLILDIAKANLVGECELGLIFVDQVASWGQNGSCRIRFLVIRIFS